MKARLITAIILAAAVAAAIWFSPVWVYALVGACVMLIALAECSRLLCAPKGWALLAVVALALFYAMMFYAPKVYLLILCGLGALVWCTRGYEIMRGIKPPPLARTQLIQSAFMLLCAWCALLSAREFHGAKFCIAMLFIIFCADIFAFFIGRRFGKRKLAPKLSPGKTIAGLVGGITGAAAAGAACAYLFSPGDYAELGWWLGASVLAAVFGVIGDLHESGMKRRAGVKDSGILLPGHGGVLDRIDGMIAAAPVFVLLWSAREWLSTLLPA